jgi:hypothetical protein
LLGLRGLVTEKLSVNTYAGYAAAFYQGDVNPSGASHLAAMAEITYKPSVLTDMSLGFRHEFRNSVIGTYYDVDTPYVGIRQKLGMRFVAAAHARYELRHYQGYVIDKQAFDRNDKSLQAGVALDYMVQQWFFLGASYQLAQNSTNLDMAAPVTGGFDYVKHQILVRMSVSY